MALATSLRDERERADSTDGDTQRAAKRTKHSSKDDDATPRRRVLAHPYGVKPIGNFYDDMDKGIRDCRASGLGKLALLSDEHLLGLLNHLSATDLSRLALCSRACYVYSSHDELWRVLVLEEMEGAFDARTTWQDSYIATTCARRLPPKQPPQCTPIVVAGVYSDLLFQSFYCAAAPIEASWLSVETIERHSALDLSVAAFKQQYEHANRPVILTDAIANWNALTQWTDAYLVDQCKRQTFYAGGYQIPIDRYLHYSRTLIDDQPLFVFDKHFGTSVPQLATDYSVPPYFQDDLFSLLGASKRPDYRWLIVGPAKSGSSFHIDPNATNAWNGVVRGAKKWILFPPDVVPPGVHPSEDGSSVSSPVSLIEWFVTFYPQIKKLPPHQRPLEGVCKAGEVVFVPHGWWHLVLNLDESIAVTQNFVSASNVRSVLRFLRDKPDQVSGLPHAKRPELFHQFCNVLKTHDPTLFATIECEWKDEEARKNRKSKWEMLLQSNGPTMTTGDATDESLEGETAKPSVFGFGFTFE